MAIQSFQLDPAAGGVSQATFDNHAHNYRKITQFGVDSSKTYSSVVRADIVDDTETSASDNQDLEAIGITVAISPTSTPT